MRGYLIPFCCLLVVLVLSGCNWFGKGLLNVINPEAEVRMYYVFNTPQTSEDRKSLSSSRD
jgi:hypothetical protein